MIRGVPVGFGEGKVVKEPSSVFTREVHHCLALVLYDAVCEVAGLAHIYDIAGPKPYSGDNAVGTLLGAMTSLDGRVSPESVECYLVGETVDSQSYDGSRTDRVNLALGVVGISKLVDCTELNSKVFSGHLRDVEVDCALKR